MAFPLKWMAGFPQSAWGGGGCQTTHGVLVVGCLVVITRL